MIFVGIDNGKDGGIVALDDHGKIILNVRMPIVNGNKKSYDIPKIVDLLSALKNGDDINVMLEKAWVTPIAGKHSCFGMGYCLGMMEGILSGLKIPYAIVSARTWQKVVLRDTDGSDTKAQSILWAKRMFPEHSWLGTDRSKKPHNGMTDACAMAYYSFINRI